MKPRIEKHSLVVPQGAADLFSSVCEAGARRHYALWLRANQAAVSSMNGSGVQHHLPAMKLAIATLVLKILNTALPAFSATHKHAEGGLYQVMGECKVHTDRDSWVDGVRYRNEKGEEFIRTKADFNKRMTGLK